MSVKQDKYFYVTCNLDFGGVYADSRLSSCSDRHRITLTRPVLNPVDRLLESAISERVGGLILEMNKGWANKSQLKTAKNALRKKLIVWFYWPKEGAIECIDEERHSSYTRLWAYIKLVQFFSVFKNKVCQFINKIQYRAKQHIQKKITLQYEALCQNLIQKAAPSPLNIYHSDEDDNQISGLGVYLRTDYWAPISTGGSYGHTCYVAKELAASTDSLICFLANRFSMLDDMGLNQQVMPVPFSNSDELSIILANKPYYDFLLSKMESLKPAYIYERICLGNFVGARLSLELAIPYIVEYNGSEISMRRSFDGIGYEYEKFYLLAEEFAFKQATVISVVSEIVKEDLLCRGIDNSKILVNPNGVDLNAYAPMPQKKRQLLRKNLGFTEADRVVGFIGTFGGWHGIDVLSEAIPLTCSADQNIRFLLIGDGNFKHLVDSIVTKYDLYSRVICTGRVPHNRGAELLGVCDIFISPHSSHMVDSKFFGSPTKLFEYMAMGCGIVGSNLEQIGQVLSPALCANTLDTVLEVDQERSVLCKPGDVGEFVKAVLFLARHPKISDSLGRNAQIAVKNDFSWRSHVERLWNFAVNK